MSKATVFGCGALAMCVLAACGGGGKSKASTSLTLPALPASGPTSSAGSSCRAEPQGPPVAKVRVANLYAPGGQAGPAIDLYDTSRPCPADKPLIAALAYGQISAYVSPRASSQGGSGQLYMFPAGSQTYGTPLMGTTAGSNISNAGWTAGQQLTYVIGTNAQGGNGNPNASFDEIDEVVPSTESPMVLANPPAGDGVLVVNGFGIPHEDTDPTVVLGIDSQCPSDVDPTTGKAKSTDLPGTISEATADFAVTTGSHTLTAVANTRRGSTYTSAQCAAAPSAGTTSVTASSSPLLVLVYGPTLQNLSFVTAPIG